MTEPAVNYEKMTVLQLRDLLKQRGLNTTGTKAILISRLMEPSASDAAPQPAAEPADSTNGAASVTSDDLLNEAVDSTDALSPKTKATPAAPAAKPTETAATPAAAAAPAINDGNDKPEKVPVTGPEAKLARAQRFGLPLSGDALKAKRAERFGLNTSPNGGSKEGGTAVNPEVLRKRAERFGLPIKSDADKPTGDAALPPSIEKLAARAKRFGVSTDTAEVALKKKARLERFGPA